MRENIHMWDKQLNLNSFLCFCGQEIFDVMDPCHMSKLRLLDETDEWHMIRNGNWVLVDAQGTWELKPFNMK